MFTCCEWLTGEGYSFLQKRDWEDETGRNEERTIKIKGKKRGKLRRSKTKIKIVFFNITKGTISWPYLKAR
jgi:hypothetical protein